MKQIFLTTIYRHIMTNIQTFQFNTKDITCHAVNGDPWFKGNDIASILGYAVPNNAAREHIPEKFKQSYQSLISSVGPLKQGVSTITAKRHCILTKQVSISSYSVRRINKLRRSPIGYVARSFPLLGNMAHISPRRRLSSCTVWLTMIKRRRYGGFATQEERLKYITTW